MEFLEKFVIPQSAEHIQLLHYLAMLIFILFIPFISMVFGGISLSLYYKKKGIKENNSDYIKFSEEIIEVATVNKGVGVILGIVPVLGTALIYAQLLHLSNTLAVGYLSVSFLLVTLSLILVYTYRYSTKFSILFSSIDELKTKDSSLTEEITELRDSSKRLSSKSGYYGLIFLIITVWIFISGISIATLPKEWSEGGFFSIIFSWTVIVRFLFFIAMAFAFTGGTILFRYFYWEGGKKNLNSDYKEFIRKTGVNLTLYSSLILPIFLAFILFALPDTSVSGAIFGYSTIALILMFLCYHLLYSMLKDKNTNYSGLLYLTLILIFISVVIKDQLAVDNATQMQAVVLNSKYEDMMAALTGAGNKGNQISGEEIYNNICSSCHSFDHKVVGPPYKQTLPKYEGKEDQLVAFVLNPKQNNPGYPPMPNPGLRPDQARAVAKWLLSVYKTK